MQCAWAVLYSNLWQVYLYHIFTNYLTKGTSFGVGGGKQLLHMKCVFWFSLQILSETFIILKRIKRDIAINVHRPSFKVPVTLVTSWWNEFSLPIFEKSNIKFHENPSSSSRVLFHTEREEIRKLTVTLRKFLRTRLKRHTFLISSL